MAQCYFSISFENVNIPRGKNQQEQEQQCFSNGKTNNMLTYNNNNSGLQITSSLMLNTGHVARRLHDRSNILQNV